MNSTYSPSISEERVKNRRSDAFLCPICHNILWKPQQCSKCQQPICENCIATCLRHNPGVCPMCRLPYQEQRCMPQFYNFLCELQIECCNRSSGCNQILFYEQLEQHETQECGYEIKECRGCKEKVIKQELIKHEKGCEFIKKTCRNCRMIYGQKQKHELLD
ncbi:unnamed protein product, partial [Didymodactylos carnosus]